MEKMIESVKRYLEENKGKEAIKEFEKLIEESEDKENAFENYMYNENLEICSDCGECVPGDTTQTFQGDCVCESCFENDYIMCCECGEIERIIYATYTEENGYYCARCAEDCLTYCECCERYVESDNVHRVYEYSSSGDYEFMCIDCINNNDIYTCSQCGEYIQNTVYIEEADIDLCENCHNEYMQEHNEHIRSYGYKPTPIFYATPEEQDKMQTIPYYGVELEIDRKEYINTTRDTVKDLNDILGEFAYYKHDGSLSDEGIEIVTHPASLKHWEKNKNKMAEAFESAVKSGYRSHNTNTCGLHIHANRKYLSENREEQENIIDRIILILETFKEQVKKFSRRHDYGYCGFLSDKMNGYLEEHEKSEYMKKVENIKKQKGRFGRYVTLNVENYNTIELRVMRGTLNVDTFYACLQFYNNIIEIAKKNTLEQLNGLMWNNIIELNNFTELQEYNKKRNIENDVVLVIRKEKESK